MRSGAAADGMVTIPRSAVWLNDLERLVESVDVRRSLPSDLPASVATGSGITGATGSVTWAQEQAIKVRDDNPWVTGQAPIPGSTVEAHMDAGAGALHRMFVGAIADTDGGSGKSQKSNLVDHLYHFSKDVSIEPLLRIMPPTTPGGMRRWIGLTPIYHVDQVLRKCGYYLTPGQEWDPAVDVPMQSSMWPENGTLVHSRAQPGSSNSHASFWQADGKMYGGDFDVEYLPRAPRPISAPVQISWTVGADQAGGGAGLTDVDLIYGLNTLRLRIYSKGNVSAWWNGTRVLFHSDFGSTWRRMTLLVKGSTWTLRTDDGQEVTGTQATSGTENLSAVRASALVGARIAGLRVNWPRDNGFDEFRYLSDEFAQNAHVVPGSISYGLIEQSPTIEATRALDVLLSISKMMLAPMWLDEDGHFRMAGCGVLRNQSPGTTVKAKHSVLGMDWRMSLDSVRASVAVKWDRAEVTLSIFPRVTFWTGETEAVSPGSEINEIISVPDDEEWYQPSLPGEYAGAPTGGDERLNRGWDTWVGGYPVDPSDGGPAGGWFTPSNGVARMEKISNKAYKFHMSVTSIPSGADHYSTEMSPSSVGLWPKWDGKALPIFRGYAIGGWVGERVQNQAAFNGPVDRPVLTHEGGWCLQRGPGYEAYGSGDSPGKTANWLAQQVMAASPFITRMDIMPDPRIQLGDVVGVEDPDNVGVIFTGLVTETSITHANANMSESLGLRVISANPTLATWGMLHDVWLGANWGQLHDNWLGSTYGNFEDDPLRRN